MRHYGQPLRPLLPLLERSLNRTVQERDRDLERHQLAALQRVRSGQIAARILKAGDEHLLANVVQDGGATMVEDHTHAATQLAVILERDEDAARGAPAWDGEGDVEGPCVRVAGQVHAHNLLRVVLDGMAFVGGQRWQRRGGGRGGRGRSLPIDHCDVRDAALPIVQRRTEQLKRGLRRVAARIVACHAAVPGMCAFQRDHQAKGLVTADCVLVLRVQRCIGRVRGRSQIAEDPHVGRLDVLRVGGHVGLVHGNRMVKVAVNVHEIAADDQQRVRRHERVDADSSPLALNLIHRPD